ncbi:MAG: hypothetical protein NTY09_03480, partial [bacterium]|nr:hypothetical protein [bacterium]
GWIEKVGRKTMAPEIVKINKKLKGVQTRLQLRTICRWAARGLAVGALLAVILMIVSKFTPIGVDIIRASISIVVAGLLIGAVAALFKPITLFDAALSADIKLGIKERLTSAIEFAKHKDENPLVPALIQDAERHAGRIKPTRDFPIRFPREAFVALSLIILAAGLYFLPPWQYVFASDENRQEYVNVAAEAERVRELAQEIRIDPPAERADVAEEVASELEQLAEDMEFGTLTRREALERLANIEEAINQVSNEQGYDQLREQFDNVAEQLAQNENLAETSEALQSGDAAAAQEAMNQLASDMEAGRVPIENFDDIANTLDQASQSLGDNPENQELRNALEQARNEIRAAASEGGAGQTDPAAMAQALIDAIDAAISEIQNLEISDEVKDRATSMLEDIRNDLQQALDSGSISQQDIDEAQQGIQEVRQMLEEAGVDLSGGNQDTRTDQEIAQELIQEAQRLEQAAQNSDQLSEEQRQELQSTCQSVAQNLQNQVSQGSCSQQSNQEARQQLDEVRQQLEENGASQEQMGEKTDCQSGQGNNSGQSGQQGSQSGQQGSGMSGLFNMQSSNGNQGQSGQSGQMGQQLGEAASACRNAGQCMGQYGESLSSCNSFSQMQQGINNSRSSMCNGNRDGGQSNNGTGAQSWGVGTTNEAAGNYQVQSLNMNDPSQNPDNQSDAMTDYEALYSSRFKPGQSYDTQVEGKFTDQGGSYIFTEVVDPETGETSYVPYFELEQTDVTALMDSMEDQDIPRSYADFVRFYFEQLADGSQSSGDSGE